MPFSTLPPEILPRIPEYYAEKHVYTEKCDAKTEII